MERFFGERLFEAGQVHAHRPFLVGDQGMATYADAWGRIGKLAQAVIEGQADSSFVGVFSERTSFAYASILAALLAGKAYVPLNPRMPDNRIASIIEQSGVETVFVGKGLEGRMRSILEIHEKDYSGKASVRLLVCEDTIPDGANGGPAWQLQSAFDHALDGAQRPASGQSLAYLLFTSGSTGKPKGVPVTNENVCSYLDYVCSRYAYGPDDVHSQTFELSFDLSVHDMGCAWTTGGSIVPMSGGALLAPHRSIAAKGITCWFSVPSVGLLMERQKGLTRDYLGGLRVSLFCGEAMPVGLAEQWIEAVPDGIVENTYGPTEATIAFTHFACTADALAKSRRGLTPIGTAFAGQRAELLDESSRAILAPDAPGVGELVLAGSQVTPGYHEAPEITERQYISDVHGGEGRWYRTGDLVERDEEGVLHFIGRIDLQVKLHGYRIELSEVEEALRKAAGTMNVAVVPWAREGGPVESLVAVVSSPEASVEEMRTAMAAGLPGYMLPRSIEVWDELPLNLNGKVDRAEIKRRLAE